MNLRHLIGACAALVLLAATLPAQASSWRTYVSPAGNDANTASNCGLTTPCRQFGAALSVTDSGGEIVVLASGNYGYVNIDKSVTIAAPPGIYAGMSVFAAPPNPTGNGITIATAGVSVTLKGLTINGMGGQYGIYMSNGASLNIQGCTLAGFGSPSGWPGETAQAAIYVNTGARVTVTDTVIRDSAFGIRFAGGAQAEVHRVQAIRTALGVGAVGPASDTATTKVSISDSLATQGYVGFAAYGRIYCGSCSTQVVVTDSVASFNSYNIVSEVTGATLTASANRAVNGGYGLFASSGTFNSAGNNVATGNSGDVAGTITSIAGAVFL